MQKANAYGRNDEPDEIPSEEGAAQRLEQILGSGLPSPYRRAYRMPGNATDAEDAVQDALIAAYTHLDQFRGLWWSPTENSATYGCACLVYALPSHEWEIRTREKREC